LIDELSQLADLHQHGANLDLPLLDVYCALRSGDPRSQLVQHLHRLHHQRVPASLHLLPGAHSMTTGQRRAAANVIDEPIASSGAFDGLVCFDLVGPSSIWTLKVAFSLDQHFDQAVV
jgi:hypothetical protein